MTQSSPNGKHYTTLFGQHNGEEKIVLSQTERYRGANI